MRRRGRRVFDPIYDEIEIAGRPIPDTGRDTILWRHNEDDYKDHFSTLRTWDQIKVKAPKVSWHRLVWFPQGVPRQAFIVWLAFKNRLSTGVRMRKWEITQGGMLCREREESRDPLFFACAITFTIWTSLTLTCWVLQHHWTGLPRCNPCCKCVAISWMKFF